MEVRKTALNAVPRAAKAKMVAFGGWDIPVDCCDLICGIYGGRADWLDYGAGMVSVSAIGLEMLAGRVREMPIIQMMLTKRPTGMK
jgi:aminomethyltransferase